MIGRLRKRFIRIAMLSVALVMLLLTLVVNIANFISVNADLDSLLEMLGAYPGLQSFTPPEDDPFHGAHGAPKGEEEWFDKRGDRRFNSETPFSTRYFVLSFDESGTLTDCDLAHIAAVAEEETDEYLSAALRRGEGSAYYGSYKLLVTKLADGTYRAVFVDCYSQLRSVRTVFWLTLLADTVCLALVYALVVLFSKKAIDPVVRSAQQQKQFITDASHELKTPLTVMTTSLKVLEMEVGQSKWIDKASAQTEKMTELVNSLVTLSRMDEEEPPITLTDFDISSAVEETAESFRDSAAAEAHALTLAVTPNLSYHGDETAVRQLVSILMDNAVKYASPGGEIALSLKKEHGAIVIRQTNPCEPLSPEVLSKLFDRFYRADESRTEKKGFGVGLSIARGIAEAHKGSVSAACPREGMIEFTAVLK